MHKISLKKIKYDEMQVLKNYFETGITTMKISVKNPEQGTVLATIAQLYVMFTKKMLFADTQRLYTLSLTASEAMAILAYSKYIKVENTYSAAVISSVNMDLSKQLN